jgi:hypothetical protein
VKVTYPRVLSKSLPVFKTSAQGFGIGGEQAGWRRRASLQANSIQSFGQTTLCLVPDSKFCQPMVEFVVRALPKRELTQVS